MRFASIHGLIRERLEVLQRLVVSVARSVTGPSQSFGGSTGSCPTEGAAGSNDRAEVDEATEARRGPTSGGAHASPATFIRPGNTLARASRVRLLWGVTIYPVFGSPIIVDRAVPCFHQYAAI
jgi:hypothetical protein